MDKFYSKKLEGLQLIRDHLLAIDKVYVDLAKLELMTPAGDPYEEYQRFNEALSDVRAQLECLILPTRVMAAKEK